VEVDGASQTDAASALGRRPSASCAILRPAAAVDSHPHCSGLTSFRTNSSKWRRGTSSWETRLMFNVRPDNFTPGFHVGFDGGEPGFNIAEPDSFHEVAPSPSPNFDLAANPYWRLARDRLSSLGWGETGLAPVSQFGSGMAAPAAPSAAANEEMCSTVGRVGPYCLYRCPIHGDMVYRPYPGAGPCPPFQVRGYGTLPWGDPPSPKSGLT
jgi:hypothetical protein